MLLRTRPDWQDVYHFQRASSRRSTTSSRQRLLPTQDILRELRSEHSKIKSEGHATSDGGDRSAEAVPNNSRTNAGGAQAAQEPAQAGQHSSKWCRVFFPGGEPPLVLRNHSATQIAARYNLLFGAARAVYHQYESDPGLFNARVTMPLEAPTAVGAVWASRRGGDGGFRGRSESERPVVTCFLQIPRRLIVRALKAGALASVCREHLRTKQGMTLLPKTAMDSGGHGSAKEDKVEENPSLMTSFALEDVSTYSLVGLPLDGDSLPGEAVDGITSFRTSSTWRDRAWIDRSLLEISRKEEASRRRSEVQVEQFYVPDANDGADFSQTWKAVAGESVLREISEPNVDFTGLDAINKTAEKIHSDVVNGEKRLDKVWVLRQQLRQVFQKYAAELASLERFIDLPECRQVIECGNAWKANMVQEFKRIEAHQKSPSALFAPEPKPENWMPVDDIITKMVQNWTAYLTQLEQAQGVLAARAEEKSLAEQEAKKKQEQKQKDLAEAERKKAAGYDECKRYHAL